MLALVLAGETIYTLIYALARDFKSSMLEAFNVSNVELGTLTSNFAIIAMLSYFPGGWLADKHSCRKLLTISLISTGLGGFYMASFPGYTMLFLKPKYKSDMFNI